MIEEVEELSPELQIGALAERQWKILDDREIRVDEARSVDWSTRRSAKLASWSLCESARIEPVLKRMNLRGAACLTALITRFVWVADLVGTLVRASVI